MAGLIQFGSKGKAVTSAATLAAVILGVVAFCTLTPIYALPQGSTGVQIQQVSTSSPLAGSLLAGSPPTRGSPNASVTIVEFGDFQCPTCDGWFKTQEAAVIQNIVDAGKAKLVWRDFDFYGPDSISASEAAYSAGDQGMFWQFHDLLFQRQQTPNSGWASRQNLVKFAQQLGLNMTKFNQDFNSGKYDPLINSNHALGVQAGVSETPTFYLVGPSGNIVTIAGPQPEPVFAQAVTQLKSMPAPEFQNFTATPLIALLITLGIVEVYRKNREEKS